MSSSLIDFSGSDTRVWIGFFCGSDNFHASAHPVIVKVEAIIAIFLTNFW